MGPDRVVHVGHLSLNRSITRAQAKILQSLKHPNIVGLEDFFVEG